ncbi:MAG: hypothetical protein WA117_11640 [Verrucomicrobiia bacterium]
MPAADPITAVANAVTAIVGVAAPLLAEHEAQAHEQERIALLSNYAAAAAAGDIRRMHACFDIMLAAAGEPVASRSGECVRLGAEYLDAFARVISRAVKTQADLNSLALALTSLKQ